MSTAAFPATPSGALSAALQQYGISRASSVNGPILFTGSSSAIFGSGYPDAESDVFHENAQSFNSDPRNTLWQAEIAGE